MCDKPFEPLIHNSYRNTASTFLPTYTASFPLRSQKSFKYQITSNVIRLFNNITII